MKFDIPEKIQNFIGGSFLDPIDGQYIENINPATAQILCQIPNSNKKDIDLAVSAAEKALSGWKNTSNETRFIILNKIATLIDAHLKELALIESTDNGKPVSLSEHVDIPRAAENFRFYATSIMHFASESHSMEGKAINYTLRKPIGIVGCISPWNLPLYLFTWKIAPALAAGNCVIAKPSEVTPLSAYMLAKICKEAGLPDGVLNIVHGDGQNCGSAIVEHELIKAISFTGSTRAGKDIAAKAGQSLKKVSLELGGKNPNIIFDDCDWDKMIKTTVQSSFANQGQICLCGSRIYVQRSIYDRFITEFVARVKRLTVGDPLLETSKQGAVVSKVHYDKVLSCIELAKAEGGTILLGGHAVHPEGRCENGYFIAPTIITNLDINSRTNQEEIFGPVVSITPFDEESEVLSYANNSSYGLSATVWTQNLDRAHRLGDQIESGIIWVNTWLLRDLRTPFGGFKNSGIGREGGWDALKFFTEPKNVCIAF